MTSTFPDWTPFTLFTYINVRTYNEIEFVVKLPLDHLLFCAYQFTWNITWLIKQWNTCTEQIIYSTSQPANQPTSRTASQRTNQPKPIHHPIKLRVTEVRSNQLIHPHTQTSACLFPLNSKQASSPSAHTNCLSSGQRPLLYNFDVLKDQRPFGKLLRTRSAATLFRKAWCET